MWFKQLSFYVLPPSVDTDALGTAMAKRPFVPCSGLDWFSTGWRTPAEHSSGMLHSNNGAHMFAMKRQDKVLPAASIREATDEKVKGLESAEHRKVGRKERLAIKEQVTDDLLPRAITKTCALFGYIDNQSHLLIVGSATSSKAEAVVSQLREALPPFPAIRPRTAIAPHTAMTDWLAAGDAPDGFELDADVEMRDSSENGATVRCLRMDLTTDEIRQHIATGKQVVKLGLIWRERVRFLLTDELQIKRIQFLDVLQDEAAQAGDDNASLFDATFLLMRDELGQMITALLMALGGLEE